MIIKPPNYILNRVPLFLAGSINQGQTEDWQSDLGKYLSDLGFIVFNPRRDDWDPSWKNGDPRMEEQIKWELDHLDNAKVVVFYFASNLMSPISLLELGLMLNTNKKIFVICEPDYPRYDNVKFTLERFNMDLYHSIELFKEMEGTRLSQLAIY